MLKEHIVDNFVITKLKDFLEERKFREINDSLIDAIIIFCNWHCIYFQKLETINKYEYVLHFGENSQMKYDIKLG